MKLSEVLENIKVPPLLNQEVAGLTTDSRKVEKGSIFFAIKGTTQDGHLFLEDVLKKNPIACVIDQNYNGKNERFIAVKDVRATLAFASHRYFSSPADVLQIFGITGTNGKTTSTYLLEKILLEANLDPAVIGTIENRYKKFILQTTHTTPGPIELAETLETFYKKGARSIAMEVTSHALDQKRVEALKFKAALFTNLTQDHLDYHASMEEYFLAKARLFTHLPVKQRAIHIDDPYGQKLVQLCEKESKHFSTYGEKQGEMKHAHLISESDGIHGTLNYDFLGSRFRETRELGVGKIQISSPLMGNFNKQNLAGVALVALLSGVDPKIISSALSKKEALVPGRLERVQDRHGRLVFVDYSHTPDSLKKALETLKQNLKGRLFCVFGCGGDRDTLKRPIMGRIAEELADYVIVTSDNPRTESPLQIIQEIIAPISSSKKVRTETDRSKAIELAIQTMKKGDLLLIAGKGHETYQIIGAEKKDFDDRVEAKKFLMENPI